MGGSAVVRDDAIGPGADGAAAKLAAELYQVLSRGDGDRLGELLHPRFEGRTTEGLPLGLGGQYPGPEAMRREFWARIGRGFVAHAEPAEFAHLEDGRLLVTGRYRGRARSGGELDAEFAHILSFSDGMISGLVQLTDSERWHAALGEHRVVDHVVENGVGEIRLNRPDARNAIDQGVVDDLDEAVQAFAARNDVRALLLTANGPAFTVGGDIAVFAKEEPAELPATLRRMTRKYHETLRTLSSLDVPIVAAVHGAVAGGGLGLLYVADLAIAAEATKFALGFPALGLSGDGASTWFLPRLIGPRRAMEWYLRPRVLDAAEALEWGLVTDVVAAAEVEDVARAEARRLAGGPTRAYGEIRGLVRDSWSATLAEQLTAEVDALTRTGATADAARAVRAFAAKSEPVFGGQ